MDTMKQEGQFQRVALLSEVPPQTGKSVTIQQKKLALFNLAGIFYAVDDYCPHRGASLGAGFLAGQRVLCPLHLFDFDLLTGACGTMPHLCVRTYEVKIEGEEIFVRL